MLLQISSFVSIFATGFAIALGGIDPLLGVIAIIGLVIVFVDTANQG
jgi:hypothetical protein